MTPTSRSATSCCLGPCSAWWAWDEAGAESRGRLREDAQRRCGEGQGRKGPRQRRESRLLYPSAVYRKALCGLGVLGAHRWSGNKLFCDTFYSKTEFK